MGKQDYGESLFWASCATLRSVGRAAGACPPLLTATFEFLAGVSKRILSAGWGCEVLFWGCTKPESAENSAGEGALGEHQCQPGAKIAAPWGKE